MSCTISQCGWFLCWNRLPKYTSLNICAMVKSRYIGDGKPSTFNRNPYNGYINPYYWVDDHPLLYGNNGSLDPGTSVFVSSKRQVKLESFTKIFSSNRKGDFLTKRLFSARCYCMLLHNYPLGGVIPHHKSCCFEKITTSSQTLNKSKIMGKSQLLARYVHFPRSPFHKKYPSKMWNIENPFQHPQRNFVYRSTHMLHVWIFYIHLP